MEEFDLLEEVFCSLSFWSSSWVPKSSRVDKKGQSGKPWFFVNQKTQSSLPSFFPHFPLSKNIEVCTKFLKMKRTPVWYNIQKSVTVSGWSGVPGNFKWLKIPCSLQEKICQIVGIKCSDKLSNLTIKRHEINKSKNRYKVPPMVEIISFKISILLQYCKQHSSTREKWSVLQNPFSIDFLI